MLRMLKNNQVLTGKTTSKNYAVLDFLGGGGQGEVYKVASNSQNFALKYYHFSQATSNQLATLENLIRIGQPSRAPMTTAHRTILRDKLKHTRLCFMK